MSVLASVYQPLFGLCLLNSKNLGDSFLPSLFYSNVLTLIVGVGGLSKLF